MMTIAKEKKKYHERLMKEVVKKYNMPDSPYKKRKLASINTHKSLRQRRTSSKIEAKKLFELSEGD